MHHHEADPIGVREAFQPGNDLIIICITVIVTADFPNLLERVYDDQRGVRMLPKKPGELFIQAIAKLFGRNGEEQVSILRRSEHAVQALLQTS